MDFHQTWNVHLYCGTLLQDCSSAHDMIMVGLVSFHILLFSVSLTIEGIIISCFIV